MAAEGAAAVGGGIVVAPGRALGDLEAVARHDGVDGAAGARGFLAVGAVAGAQAGDGRGHGVADGAAEAAAGERGHRALLVVRTDRRNDFTAFAPQSKLTISTQFEPLPVGYLPIGLSAPLDGSIE